MSCICWVCMEKNHIGNVGIKSAPHTFSPKIVIPKNTIKVAILPHPVEETLKKKSFFYF